MLAQLLTTYFVAQPDDVGRAYDIYRSRVDGLGSALLAVSEAPVPLPADAEYDYTLWDLRVQAAYGHLENPEAMQLYSLNALVDVSAVDEDIEQFFFEGEDEPTVFASFVSDHGVTLRSRPVPGMRFYRVFFLSRPVNESRAQGIFDALVEDVNSITATSSLERLDNSAHSAKIGPLCLRDTQLNMERRGDGFGAEGKASWEGSLLTAASPAEVAAAIREPDDASVLVRIEYLPF